MWGEFVECLADCFVTWLLQTFLASFFKDFCGKNIFLSDLLGCGYVDLLDKA